MIYFVQAEVLGRIKIGYSRECNLEKRMSALQVSSPLKLTLLVAVPGGRDKERELHYRFMSERIRGEWFRPSLRLSKFIFKMQERNDARQTEQKVYAPSGRLQNQVLTFLRECIRPVFVAEIAEHIGSECSNVRVVLHRLFAKGLVIRPSGASWGIPETEFEPESGGSLRADASVSDNKA